jgi:hypothetical protein
VAKKKNSLACQQAGERTLVLVSYHRVLGLVAAINKVSKTKNTKRLLCVVFDLEG